MKARWHPLAVFPDWSSWSLLTGQENCFIFIALLINVEYSQSFSYSFPPSLFKWLGKWLTISVDKGPPEHL